MLKFHEDGYIDSLSLDLRALNSDDLEDEENPEQWASITAFNSPVAVRNDIRAQPWKVTTRSISRV